MKTLRAGPSSALSCRPWWPTKPLQKSPWSSVWCVSWLPWDLCGFQCSCQHTKWPCHHAFITSWATAPAAQGSKGRHRSATLGILLSFALDCGVWLPSIYGWLGASGKPKQNETHQNQSSNNMTSCIFISFRFLFMTIICTFSLRVRMKSEEKIHEIAHRALTARINQEKAKVRASMEVVAAPAAEPETILDDTEESIVMWIKGVAWLLSIVRDVRLTDIRYSVPSDALTLKIMQHWIILIVVLFDLFVLRYLPRPSRKLVKSHRTWPWRSPSWVWMRTTGRHLGRILAPHLAFFF